ncbi:MAG: DUF6297 family protein, partial [Nakamurella sp.]
ATRPASFARFLRRRRRQTSGSGTSYSVIVLVLYFSPGIGVGVWVGLTGQPPAVPPLTVPAGVAALLAGAALIGLVCSFLGPITAPPEWRAWVLSTPLDRGVLLRTRFVAVLAGASIPGLVLGALVAGSSGLRGGLAVAGILAGALCAVLAAGVAVLLQAAAGGAAALRVWLLLLFGFVVLAALLMAIRPELPGERLTWSVTIALLIPALVSGVSARYALARISIPALATGAGASASLGLAIYEQTLTPVASVLAGDGGDRRSRSRSRPLSGVGQLSLAAVERVRVRRNRGALLRWVLLACLPYAVLVLMTGLSWRGSAVVVVTYLAGVGAVSGLCSTVRKFAQTPVLADQYGLDRSAAKSTAMQLPYLGAAGWAVLTAPALLIGAPSYLVVLVPLAGLALVTFRARQAPYEQSFTMGQEYESDFAPKLFRGPIWLLITSFLLAILVAGGPT